MALLLALSLLVFSAPASGRQFPPTDQCATDEGFVAFRAALIDAIERRDAAHILNVVSNDIHVDFGGGAGRDYFARTWALDRPEDSPLWHELGETLRLGCTANPDGAYWAPSLFAASEIEDPFATFLVIREDAPLHASGDPDSPMLANLTWELVQGVEWQEGDDWWRVRLSDGREGFMRRSDLRSPVDYRAVFERIDGRWRMTTFIAGD